MATPLYSTHKLSCRRFDPFSTTTIMSRLSLRKSIIFSKCANGKYLNSGARITRSNMEFKVYSDSGAQVVDLLPYGVHLPENWPAWLPGVLLAIVVPFFTNKLGPFGKFKAELDKVEETVDNVADRMEEIAEKVEEFVGDIADDLPEGSQFRMTLEKVENVADKIGRDARMVSDIVDKMDEMEAKLESILDKEAEKKKTTTPTKLEPQ